MNGKEAPAAAHGEQERQLGRQNRPALRKRVPPELRGRAVRRAESWAVDEPLGGYAVRMLKRVLQGIALKRAFDWWQSRRAGHTR